MPDVRLRASDESRRMIRRTAFVVWCLAIATGAAAQTAPRQLVIPFENAARTPQSVRFTVVACTLTRTSLSLAAGCTTSGIRTASGGP